MVRLEPLEGTVQLRLRARFVALLGFARKIIPGTVQPLQADPHFDLSVAVAVGRGHVEKIHPTVEGAVERHGGFFLVELGERQAGEANHRNLHPGPTQGPPCENTGVGRRLGGYEHLRNAQRCGAGDAPHCLKEYSSFHSRVANSVLMRLLSTVPGLRANPKRIRQIRHRAVACCHGQSGQSGQPHLLWAGIGHRASQPGCNW